jgi:hypothetical protein
MERSFEKLTGFQQFPAFYGTPEFHYRIHNFPPIVPILSHLDPVHAFTYLYHFLKIQVNIILPSKLLCNYLV